jgi:hypothetical protein
MPEEYLDHPPMEPTSATRVNGRCDQCGYTLIGLPLWGVCPECGAEYTESSALRLQPWPNAGMLCLRLGWPLLGMVVAVVMGHDGARDAQIVTAIFLGWGCAIALPVNSYFQVRSMLKKSLPEQRRTEGGIAVLRAIGTTICVLLFLALIGPFVILAACLMSISRSGFH